jgi:uncharacterized membrane-anchored protein
MTCTRYILLFVMSITLLSAFGQQPEYNFIEGPKKVTLENDIAVVELPKGYVFLDKADTEKMLREMAEPAEKGILGSIIKPDDETKWYALITYDDIGYVQDDEADKLDAGELLNQIQEGTKESNEERVKMGGVAIHVTGWFKSPTYTRNIHTLSWSITGKDETSPELFANFVSIVLGRHGILTLTMVGGVNDAPHLQRELDNISRFTKFNQGRDYESFVSGDRLADITMTGLITGGTAAGAYALAKTGLLAKFAKLLIIPAIALIAFLKRFLSKFTGRGNTPTPTG